MFVGAEGFDGFGSVADMPYKGYATYGSAAVSLVAGRTGGQALRFSKVYNPAAGQSAAYFTGGCLDFPLRWAGRSIVFGFAFRVNSPWNRDYFVPLCSLYTNYGPVTAVTIDNMVNLILQPNGQLAFSTSTTNVDAHTSISAVNFQASPNTWYYVEVKIVMGNPNASNTLMTVRVNNSQIFSQSANSALGGELFERFRLGHGIVLGNQSNPAIFYSSSSPGTLGTLAASYAVDFDDCYILDTTKPPRADFLSAVVVKSLKPVSDISVGMARTPGGNSSNASCVNETAFDSDSSYVTATNAGDKDVYQLGTLAGTGAVHGVIMNTVSRQVSGAGRIAGVVRYAGTDYYTEDRFYPTGAYTAQRFYMETQLLPTQPDWDVTSVNAAGFGVAYEGQGL